MSTALAFPGFAIVDLVSGPVRELATSFNALVIGGLYGPGGPSRRWLTFMRGRHDAMSRHVRSVSFLQDANGSVMSTRKRRARGIP